MGKKTFWDIIEITLDKVGTPLSAKEIAENVFESEILFPSRVSAEIDWDTVNRFASENKHFGEFLKEMAEDIKLQKVKSKYYHILTPEELEKHINEKGIK